MRRLAALAAALVLLLAGCGDHLNGKVVAKDVEPGYFIYIPITTCSGNPVHCTTIPVFYYIPPCYRLVVEGATKDESGDTCVDKDEWLDTEIGDSYVGDDVDPKDHKQKA